MSIDEFTLQHLDRWIETEVHPGEKASFRVWALEELETDSGISNYGWRSLYRRYIDEMVIPAQ